MQDHRGSARIRAFMAGRIAAGDGDATLDCVVRDLSETGALLLVDEPSRVPGDVDVTVSPNGEPRRARVVWRGEATVGVAFAPAPEGPASATVVSIAAARAARHPVDDRDRLAERVARVTHPQARARPAWAWPGPSDEAGARSGRT